MLKQFNSVVSDSGQTRYGWYVKQDGTRVPRFHKSVPAALAFSIQEMLFKRGYIDELGNPKPLEKLPIGKMHHSEPCGGDQLAITSSARDYSGRVCAECGSRDIGKRDGCTNCNNCGAIGSCG